MVEDLNLGSLARLTPCDLAFSWVRTSDQSRFHGRKQRPAPFSWPELPNRNRLRMSKQAARQVPPLGGVHLVGARNSVTSCDLGVFVEEAAEPVASDDLDVGVDGVKERPERTGMVQCPMRPVPVEMGLILGQDLARVRGVDDEHPVEDLAAHPAQRSMIAFMRGA
jgi:hypothetical protein